MANEEFKEYEVTYWDCDGNEILTIVKCLAENEEEELEEVLSEAVTVVLGLTVNEVLIRVKKRVVA